MVMVLCRDGVTARRQEARRQDPAIREEHDPAIRQRARRQDPAIREEHNAPRRQHEAHNAGQRARLQDPAIREEHNARRRARRQDPAIQEEHNARERERLQDPAIQEEHNARRRACRQARLHNSRESRATPNRPPTPKKAGSRRRKNSRMRSSRYRQNNREMINARMRRWRQQNADVVRRVNEHRRLRNAWRRRQRERDLEKQRELELVQQQLPAHDDICNPILLRVHHANGSIMSANSRRLAHLAEDSPDRQVVIEDVKKDIARYVHVTLEDKARCVCDYASKDLPEMKVCGSCGLRCPMTTYNVLDLSTIREGSYDWLHVDERAYQRLCDQPSLQLIRRIAEDFVSVQVPLQRARRQRASAWRGRRPALCSAKHVGPLATLKEANNAHVTSVVEV